MYICKFPNFGPGINIFEVLAQIPLESVWDKRFNLESNKSVFNKRLHYFKNVHIKKMFTAHCGFACTTSTSLSLFTLSFTLYNTQYPPWNTAWHCECCFCCTFAQHSSQDEWENFGMALKQLTLRQHFSTVSR